MTLLGRNAHGVLTEILTLIPAHPCPMSDAAVHVESFARGDYFLRMTTGCCGDEVEAGAGQLMAEDYSPHLMDDGIIASTLRCASQQRVFDCCLELPEVFVFPRLFCVPCCCLFFST